MFVDDVIVCGISFLVAASNSGWNHILYDAESVSKGWATERTSLMGSIFYEDD
eukprot:m.68458 g.68458  ORF g.68458 m.68458 type:complete len:53 (-) comp8245_c0_seq6:1084-1242(-)